MISKNVLSVAVIITLTVVFISSSAFVNPLWAKTTKSSDTSSPSKSSDTSSPSKSSDTSSPSTSTTSTTSSSAENNYKKFQQCLSDAEGTKGFATNQEIKSCYNPIYRPLTTSTTSPIDFSRPHVTAPPPKFDSSST